MGGLPVMTEPVSAASVPHFGAKPWHRRTLQRPGSIESAAITRPRDARGCGRRRSPIAQAPPRTCGCWGRDGSVQRGHNHSADVLAPFTLADRDRRRIPTETNAALRAPESARRRRLAASLRPVVLRRTRRRGGDTTQRKGYGSPAAGDTQTVKSAAKGLLVVRRSMPGTGPARSGDRCATERRANVRTGAVRRGSGREIRTDAVTSLLPGHRYGRPDAHNPGRPFGPG
jgi:hypothetical protein